MTATPTPGSPAPEIRLLGPADAPAVSALVRANYGDTYDAAWVYDPVEIAARIESGRLVSAGGFAPDGELLGHLGLSRHDRDEHVAEAGQAVVDPRSRGQHLFTTLKRELAGWAHSGGLYGLFSEATAAHPYSQRANVELGAHETGFLLGWIPASVGDRALHSGHGHRQSVALFYLKTNEGHDRPVYAPPRHQSIVAGVLTTCGLRGRLADAPPDASPPPVTELHEEVRTDHNLAILTAVDPGADVATAVAARRDELFADGLAAVYVDLPLELPATELVGDTLAARGFSFGGVFPNLHVEGDVLRLQCLHDVDVAADDIAVGSDHGRALLDYVLADREWADRESADRG